MSSPSSPLRRPPVLVVDDEAAIRHVLRLLLEREGYAAVEAADGAAALAQLEATPALRLALCDLRMPVLDGHGFLTQARAAHPALRVVMMSAYGGQEEAVAALARGAWAYINKPVRPDELRHVLRGIAEQDRLLEENAALRARVVEPEGAELGFVGRSAAARAVMETVSRVARYPSTVLITGESGTGKELVAQALHARSDRREGPFVPVNCAALPEGLLESELFGHERGAFTGAVRARGGLFELADKGTLLLDEIGDMPLALQSRLLRVLEDGRVRRVGGDRDREVDVRVVAATATPLEQAVEAGRFRRDLFYRLNVVRIQTPALRERPDDLPLLAHTLLHRAARRLGRPAPPLSAAALDRLCAERWPGNVRQLENVLEQAVLLATGPQIEPNDLPLRPVTRPEPNGAAAPSGGVLRLLPDDGAADLSIKGHSALLERHLIHLALQRTQGNRTQAARLLELSTKALAYKIRDYGLDISEDDHGA
ncbi:MAG: sigma-54-dependent Fis family transcriptional regulator [Deltaproteobacteria bacterium]|nr:sigma-54-dependent Fis family transcriptional regulator [Deltaproteobacteria bacterium]